MAYSRRDDGLFDVTLDNGSTVPMRIEEDALREAGHMPADMSTAFPRAGSGYQPEPDPVREAILGGVKRPGLSPYAVAGPGGGASGMGEEAGGGGATYTRPPGMAPSSVSQPSSQPGGMPPTRAQIEQDETLSPYEREQAVERMKGRPSEGGGKGGEGEAKETTGGKVDPSQLATGGDEEEAAPAYNPGRYVPGGDVRASYIRQPGVPISESVKSDLEADRRPEDTEARAKAIADLRNQQMNERESHLLSQREQLDQQRARRADIDAQIRKKQDLISQREKEAEAITPKSARDVMNDRGVLAQLAAAIAIAVGGYQQGLTGRANNVGLDLVNQSIKSDIDKQREAYEQAEKRGEVARNDYAKALELYGTPEAAEQDMEMRRLAIAEKMIQNHGEQIGTQEGLAAANNVAQVQRQDRALLRQSFEEKETGKIVQENFAYQPGRYVGGTGGGGGPATEKSVHQVGADLQSAGIPEAEAVLGEVDDLLARLPAGEAPTYDTRNLGSQLIRKGADFVAGQGSGTKMMDSPAEREAVAGIEKIKAAYRKAQSGISVSKQEEAANNRVLDGINTPEGLARYRVGLDRQIARKRAAIEAQNNPNAVRIYNERKKAKAPKARVKATRDD